MFVDKKRKSRGKKNELYKEGATELVFLINDMLEIFWTLFQEKTLIPICFAPHTNSAAKRKQFKEWRIETFWLHKTFYFFQRQIKLSFSRRNLLLNPENSVLWLSVALGFTIHQDRSFSMMKNTMLEMSRYAALARQAVAEGIVLLKNEAVLPLASGGRAA